LDAADSRFKEISDEMQKTVTALRNERNELQRQLAAKDHECLNVESSRQDSEAKLRREVQQSEQTVSKLRERSRSLETELEKALADISVLRDQNEKINAELKNRKTLFADAEKKLQDQYYELTLKEESLKSSQSEKQRLSNDLMSKEAELKVAKEKEEVLLMQVSQLDTKLHNIDDRLQQTLSSKSRDVEAIAVQLEQSTERVDQLKQEVARLRDQLEAQSEKAREAEGALNENRLKAVQAKRAFSSKSRTIERLRRRWSEANDSRKKASEKISNLRNRIKILEDDHRLHNLDKEVAETENAYYEEKIRQMQEDLEAGKVAHQSALKVLEETIKDLRTKVSKLEVQFNVLSEEKHKLLLEKKDVKFEHDQLKKKLSDVQDGLDKDRAELVVAELKIKDEKLSHETTKRTLADLRSQLSKEQDQLTEVIEIST
jgi:chromosome segregation ATPase